MSRRSAFSFKIDSSDLVRFATRLSQITPDELGETLVGVLNLAADSAYELGRKRMLNGINLDDEYLRRKMQVVHATVKNPQATITAFGGKGFITSLSHYGAMQEMREVSGRTRRAKLKGNPALGLPVGKKAAGRSVEVVKGRRKNIASAFAIPGKKDGDGNPIVFRRKAGTRKIEALTGPSVYQLFRVAAASIEEQVADDLQAAVVLAAERRIQESLR